MRLRQIFFIGATLVSMPIGAAELTLKPGSSAVFFLKPARAAVASADATPPTTTAGPSVSGIGENTVTLSATINEKGTGYYLVRLASDTSSVTAATMQSSGISFPMYANIAVTQNITGLTGDTNYKIYFIAKDASNNVQPAVTNVAFKTLQDNTPPTTTALEAVSTTDTATTLSATINEAGTGRYLVALASDPLPNLQTVKDGTAFSMTANVAANANITGLKGSTSYKIYFVAKDLKDASNNWQTAYSIVTVTTEPDVTPPVTLAGPEVSDTTATSTKLSATINESGTGHYVVQTSGGAPSADQVILGQNGSGVAALKSGSSAMAANAVTNMNITGLSSSTSYTIYFVAKDTSNNAQTVVQSVPVTTSADLCAVDGASVAIGTCCTDTVANHALKNRAYPLGSTYYAKNSGCGVSLGSNTSQSFSLKKTTHMSLGYCWQNNSSCP